MTFYELVDIEPNIRLADLIQLFLLGGDDKIYIDLYHAGADGISIEKCRIIDPILQPYYEQKITRLEEGIYGNNTLLSVYLEKI